MIKLFKITHMQVRKKSKSFQKRMKSYLGKNINVETFNSIRSDITEELSEMVDKGDLDKLPDKCVIKNMVFHVFPEMDILRDRTE